MAYTQTQLTALEEAFAQGVLEVQYSDKKVTYRSLDEMKQIIETIKKSLGTSNTNQVGSVKMEFSKGL